MDPCCSNNNVNSCSGGVGAEGGGQAGGEGGGGGDRRGGQSRSVSNSVKGVRHSSHVETKVRPCQNAAEAESKEKYGVWDPMPELTITSPYVNSRGGMHSQASYWVSIGFKQMVCTVATCYWFLAPLWFSKTRSFLSLEHYNRVRVPYCPKFFLFILTIIFSHYSGTY